LLDLLDRLQATLEARYTIDREVGHGGMAVVYRAHDTRHDRMVALKVLQPRFSEVLGAERFLLEIRVAARLHHPHLLPLYDSGDADGLLYYVMPYIEGGSLRDRLVREGRLDLGTALRLMREVADALDYAHRSRIVHRDIKPENILLEEGHAVVADFGVACAVSAAADTGLTQPGMLVGTPAYMSPEQATDASVDGRSDIYALGCVLYETLTGQPPFTGTTPMGLLTKRFTQPAPDLRSAGVVAPRALERITASALAANPEHRLQTAGEMAEALAAVDRDTRRSVLTPPATPAVSARRLTTLAVLPFVNMSSDPDNEFFSDGITEELINAFARLPGLRVTSRSSAFTYKTRDVDVREIGKRLNVEAVLEGSVRRAGNRLRITAQLINATDGYHLWSETFDRELADVFEVQDELSRSIVRTLQPQLAGIESDTLVAAPTTSLEAYNLYLKGRYFWNRRTPDSVRKGIAFFEEAIAIDPEFAPAYTGVADSYHVLALYGALSPVEAYPLARAAAERALALNGSLAESHTSMAYVSLCYDWDWETAERGFRRAIELSPGSGPTHHWLGWTLVTVGRFSEAAAEARLAAELDPLSPLINARAGHILTYSGRADEGAAVAEHALELDPNFAITYEVLALARVRQDRGEEAVELLQRAVDLPGSTARYLLPWVCAMAGRTAEAADRVRELELDPASGPLPPGYSVQWVAAAYAMLGGMDQAFHILQRALEERRFSAILLRVEQSYAPMRADPRFEDLLRRTRLDAPGTPPSLAGGAGGHRRSPADLRD
jgi:serine/threonine-protein kinase